MTDEADTPSPLIGASVSARGDIDKPSTDGVAAILSELERLIGFERLALVTPNGCARARGGRRGQRSRRPRDDRRHHPPAGLSPGHAGRIPLGVMPMSGGGNSSCSCCGAPKNAETAL